MLVCVWWWWMLKMILVLKQTYQYCQARVLVLVIVLDYSLRLVSIPVSKGPELKLLVKCEEKEECTVYIYRNDQSET